jgi:hypothetical protein
MCPPEVCPCVPFSDPGPSAPPDRADPPVWSRFSAGRPAVAVQRPMPTPRGGAASSQARPASTRAQTMAEPGHSIVRSASARNAAPARAGYAARIVAAYCRTTSLLAAVDRSTSSREIEVSGAPPENIDQACADGSDSAFNAVHRSSCSSRRTSEWTSHDDDVTRSRQDEIDDSPSRPPDRDFRHGPPCRATEPHQLLDDPRLQVVSDPWTCSREQPHGKIGAERSSERQEHGQRRIRRSTFDLGQVRLRDAGGPRQPPLAHACIGSQLHDLLSDRPVDRLRLAPDHGSQAPSIDTGAHGRHRAHRSTTLFVPTYPAILRAKRESRSPTAIVLSPNGGRPGA